MTKTATTLCALFLLSATGCDDKKGEDKKETAAKGDKAKGDDKKGGGDAKAEEKKPAEPPAPKLADAEIKEWQVKLQLPEGAAVTELEEGDADMEMPDSATLTTEKACGYDIDLTRHWKKSLDSMYENSKKAADGLTEIEFLKDEKTDTGYTVHYKGKAPLGDMYGASTGIVIGDRLVLCDSGLGRQEKHEAACVLAVCSTVAGAEAGAPAEAKGDAKADKAG